MTANGQEPVQAYRLTRCFSPRGVYIVNRSFSLRPRWDGSLLDLELDFLFCNPCLSPPLWLLWCCAAQGLRGPAAPDDGVGGRQQAGRRHEPRQGSRHPVRYARRRASLRFQGTSVFIVLSVLA